jgi:glucose/arabinose dehydrogenase
MTAPAKTSMKAGLMAATALTFALNGFAAPACDADNAGLKLPAGFCAFLAADNIGVQPRHIAVAPNGDVYVALMGRRNAGGGVVAMRPDANGKFTAKEAFGAGSSTGIGLRNGYLYVATTTTVVRYKMTPGQLKPTGEMETVVTGLPEQNEHEDKGLTFDGKGSLYVNVGAPSNACQSQDRRAKIAGQDPCPILEEHGGIWKFDENKLGQKQSDGVRFATGLRQMPAITWHDGAVYIAMNSRDQLDTLWGEMFSAKENAERPAEPLYRAEQGDNFGWPFCFFDYGLQKLILNPEYGGDGVQQGRCATSGFKLPVATFPAHWAPVDITFYDGKQFPAHYKDGAFIAFHGSWNRAPLPQDGFFVGFQPFASGKPSGKYEIFADGFAGAEPVTGRTQAQTRPDGVAAAPDGSLYITDSQKGKIWRVMYTGK